MNDRFKVRAWVIAEKQMMDRVEVSPFHVGDCDRYRWKHDEVVLMQCAGTKDDNERLIYEGDIVKYENTIESGIAVVEAIFESNSLYYKWISQSTDRPTPWSPVDHFGCQSELKIIGNRYSNPELMEGNNG